MNRASTAGILDANSQLPATFNGSILINVTNTTTTISGAAGVFRGFLVIAPAAGAYTLTAYDSSTTAAAGLTSATAVGILASTTAAGALPFQWGGDIVVVNGITVVSQGGTAGAIKVFYL